MRILAIETSCDETSIAIAEFGTRRGQIRPPLIPPRGGEGELICVRVLSHIILSQIPVHKKFGGVVPNLAKREHQRNLVPILLTALREADLQEFRIKNLESRKVLNSKFQILNSILGREPELLKAVKKRIVPLAPPKIDAVAVTYGPGLAPALWVGVNFAKALAYIWEKPLIPVNHMAGHLYSAILQRNSKREARNSKQIQNSKFKAQNCFGFRIADFEFPAIALLVSGGHTELVLMRGHGKFKVIGETLDDAAGEAFDKAARILGLGYPGGPEISRLAALGESYRVRASSEVSEVQPRKISLPRPMLNSKDYNFSFSGLKTAVLYLVRDLGPKRTKKLRPLIAKEFQDAVVEVLVKKTVRAAKKYGAKTILLGGGVAANKALRSALESRIKNQELRVRFMPCEVGLAGDNALMIATAAYFSGKKISPMKLGADANLRLA